MYTIQDIKNVVFTRVGRGYRTDEVDEFIEEVVRTVEAMQQNNETLMQKLGVLADKIEDYRAQEGSIHNALLTAQRMADQITKDAEAAAARLKEESERTAAQLESEARQKASALTEQAEADYQAKLADTKQQATKVIAEAKDRSGRMLFEALEKSRAERAALEEMKRQTKSFKDQLITMYHEQIALIERLASQERVIASPSVSSPAVEPIEAEASIAPASEDKVQTINSMVEEEASDASADTSSDHPEITSNPEPMAETRSSRETDPVEEAVPDADRPVREPILSAAENLKDVPSPVTKAAGVAPTRFQIDADVEEERASKFSNLKFGEDYDLSDDEDYLEEEPARGFFKRKKK